MNDGLKKRIIFSLVFVFFLSLSLAEGFYLGRRLSRLEFSVKEIRDGNSEYKFINPLLDVEFYSPSSELWTRKAKQEVVDFVDKKNEESDNSIETAFYYRDLNNGPWFGSDEKDNFIPASLLKLPLAIAYFKWLEADQSIFDKELLFSEDLFDKDEVYQFSPKARIEIGKTYKVSDLIERMIVYSDNDAKTVLLANIDQDFLAKVYSDLGVNMPSIDLPSDFMSTKEYSSFYRVLYNASYLNRANSNRLLEILSKADFKNGLLAGLPEDLVVAHKFGERGFVSPDNRKQLHDCGIVYHPKHPYILCVMTRGQDYNDLAKIISGVSKIVYENIKD